MHHQSLQQRFLIVFCLGFSSGLPFSLTSSTLQAWFADSGCSIAATAMISLVGLPYVFRVLWGPFVDRYSLFSIGKRRGWIFFMQLLICIALNLIAFLSPETSPQTMLWLALLLACCSATQDLAIDAHRIEYLMPSDQGLGASLAMLGYRIALFTAGGVALIMAQHAGWSLVYRTMSVLMLIGMFALSKSPEPSMALKNSLSFTESLIAPGKELLARPGIMTLCCFILFYKLGEAFTTTNSGIVMPFLIQGLGFSLDSIAYVNKLIGMMSIVFGGLVAGILLLRWSLHRALLLFGLLQALTNLLFLLLAIFGKNIYLLAVAVVGDNVAAGMGSTALVALFMQLVDRRFTATQFSMLVALSTLPRVFSGPIGAMIQLKLGWVGLFQFAFLLSLVFVPLLFRLKNKHFRFDAAKQVYT